MKKLNEQLLNKEGFSIDNRAKYPYRYLKNCGWDIVDDDFVYIAEYPMRLTSNVIEEIMKVYEVEVLENAKLAEEMEKIGFSISFDNLGNMTFQTDDFDYTTLSHKKTIIFRINISNKNNYIILKSPEESRIPLETLGLIYLTLTDYDEDKIERGWNIK